MKQNFQISWKLAFVALVVSIVLWWLCNNGDWYNYSATITSTPQCPEVVDSKQQEEPPQQMQHFQQFQQPLQHASARNKFQQEPQQQQLQLEGEAEGETKTNYGCENGVQPVVKYAIVFDAGSTGTRIHIFETRVCALEARILRDREVLFRALEPGLSHFAQQPERAAQSIVPLLDAALATVPRHLWSTTLVALYATAGMRLLGEQQVTQILTHVQHVIEQYPFRLWHGEGSTTTGVAVTGTMRMGTTRVGVTGTREIRTGGVTGTETREPKMGVTRGTTGTGAVAVITGRDEGLYGWMSVNYLISRDGREANAAVIDCGGASLQISFPVMNEVKEKTPQNAHNHFVPVKLSGNTGLIYQHSYLGYGLLEARKKIKDAFIQSLEQHSETNVVPVNCLPGDFSEQFGNHVIQGTGVDVANCERKIGQIFNFHHPCEFKTCSFNGTFHPEIEGNPLVKEIYLIQYFNEKVSNAGLAPRCTLAQLSQRIEQCSETGYLNGSRDPHLCSDLIYLKLLLKYAFRIHDQQVLFATRKLSGYEISWAVGAGVAMALDETLQDN